MKTHSLFSSDKQLLHQLVPLGVFFFRFFDAVFLVDVGFFEFLRHCSDVFAGRPQAALLDHLLTFLGVEPVEVEQGGVGMGRLEGQAGIRNRGDDWFSHCSGIPQTPTIETYALAINLMSANIIIESFA